MQNKTLSLSLSLSHTHTHTHTHQDHHWHARRMILTPNHFMVLLPEEHAGAPHMMSSTDPADAMPQSPSGEEREALGLSVEGDEDPASEEGYQMRHENILRHRERKRQTQAAKKAQVVHLNTNVRAFGVTSHISSLSVLMIGRACALMI